MTDCPINHFVRCKEDECAWFNSSTWECSILSLSDSVKFVSELIEEKNKGIIR